MARKSRKTKGSTTDTPENEKNMNALADLGLPTGEATEVEAQASTAAKTPREEVEIGEVIIGEDEDLPALVRNSGGSKYPFLKLDAPKDAGEGKFKYSTFAVNLQDGVDADKLKRSVQSAATQANRQHKAEGVRFITRSIIVKGEFDGVKVFRVDGTINDEADAA